MSRDTDYGQHIGDQSIVNEWLFTEFRERVHKRRKVMLTNKLSFAFKESVAKNAVTKQMESAEEQMIVENASKTGTGNVMTKVDRLKALQEVIDRLEREYGFTK